MSSTQRYKLIDIANMWELAYRLTVKECKKKKTKVDKLCNKEYVFTSKAQIIFDRHCDELLKNL